jgi:hypothetical protein
MNEVTHWIYLAQDSVYSPTRRRPFLSLIQGPRQVDMRGEGETEQQLQAFSTSTLDETEWSASLPGHFTLEVNSTSTAQFPSQQPEQYAKTGDKFLDSFSDKLLVKEGSEGNQS